MIPQRNISLLSNRLAIGGGRRIREDVLERDYCMAWFLAVLSQSNLKEVLAFKASNWSIWWKPFARSSNFEVRHPQVLRTLFCKRRRG
jgi:hypothetical protein